MKKSICIIICVFIIFSLFVACSINENEDKQVLLCNSSEIDPRNPGLYGTSLNSITKNSDFLKCENDLFKLDFGITNVYSACEYGYIVFVNGIRIQFFTNEDSNYKDMHTVKLPAESDEKEVSIYFSSDSIPVNKISYVSVATILNPNYILKSNDYINYLPHHAMAAYTFYAVLRQEGFFTEEVICQKVDSVSDLPDYIIKNHELREGTEKDPFGEDENAKIKNSLDNINEFILSTQNHFDGMETYFTTTPDKALKIGVAGIGKSKSYRVSCYINNKIVPVFDGKKYCDIEIKRDKLTVKDICLPVELLNQLDNYNHIYLIAVPLNPSLKESDYDRPIKTITKLLYVDNEKAVSEFKEKFVLDELESKVLNAADNKDSNTMKEPQTEIETSLKNRNVENENTTIQIQKESDEKSSTTNEVSEEITTKKTAINETTTKETTIIETTIKEATTKDTAGKEVTVKTEQISSLNGVETVNTGKKIADIWCFDNESVIVQLESRRLHTMNIYSGKLSEKSVAGGHKIQKLDNGIALINYLENSFSIYDTKLILLHKAKLPYEFGEEVEFAVSMDGKSVVYCVNENGKRNVYLSPIKLNTKKKIYTFTNNKSVGQVVWFNEIVSVENEKVLFVGSYIAKIESNGDVLEKTCYGILENGKITKQNDIQDNRTYYKGNCLVVADNSTMSGKETDGVVEYWDVKTKSKKSFDFPDDSESKYAIVSSNRDYIASQTFFPSEQSVWVKIYDISSEKLVFKKRYKAIGTLPIDFSQESSLVIIGTERGFDVIGLKGSE